MRELIYQQKLNVCRSRIENIAKELAQLAGAFDVTGNEKIARFLTTYSDVLMDIEDTLREDYAQELKTQLGHVKDNVATALCELVKMSKME